MAVVGQIFNSTSIRDANLEAGTIFKVIKSCDHSVQKEELFIVVLGKNNVTCCCIGLKTSLTDWLNPDHTFDFEILKLPG